jgi:LPS sulfotransferase NodH
MHLPDVSLREPFDDAAIEGPQPTRSYLVCATPRSGSWLLVDLLRRSGRAGVPREYFRLDDNGRLPDVSLSEFLRSVLRHGTTENGVFGAKVHWPQLVELTRVLAESGRPHRPPLDDVFPAPHHVLLRRANRARQAVSWYRAIRTNEWWQTARAEPTFDQGPDPSSEPADLQKIAELDRLLADYDASWARWFDEAGVAPLEVCYEDLCADTDGVVDAVLEHIGVPALGSAREPRLQQQADELSERWLEQYLASRSNRSRAGAPRSTGAPRSQGVAPTIPAPPLERVLASPRWISSTWPFEHVRADHVFSEELYDAMARHFRMLLDRGPTENATLGFAGGIPGYDATGYNFSPDNYGPFGVFVSRTWIDLMERLFAVSLSGHVLCGLHHHDVGSANGFVHHDLNPGFFADRPDRLGVVVARHTLCSYTTGQSFQPGAQAIETVRGVAMIYFVANPPWRSGDGGETGLYSRADDDVERPAIAIPPRSNSLVLFRCSPRSFHSFISNRRVERNSVIAWYHRPKADVELEHGADAIRPHRRS